MGASHPVGVAAEWLVTNWGQNSAIYDTAPAAAAPEIRVFVGEEAHATIFSGLRYMGFGENNLVRIAADSQGRDRAGSRLTEAVIQALARENTSFVEGAQWQGQKILRVSIISQCMDIADIERLGASIVRAWHRVKNT